MLVVEDEDGVRELVRQILTEHGHTVLGRAMGVTLCCSRSATSIRSTCWSPTW